MTAANLTPFIEFARSKAKALRIEASEQEDEAVAKAYDQHATNWARICQAFKSGKVRKACNLATRPDLVELVTFTITSKEAGNDVHED